MQVFVRSPLRRGDAPKSIACSPCGRASGRLCFLFPIFGFFRIVRFYRQRASRQVSLRKVTKPFRKNYGKMSKSCGGFPSDKKVCEYFRRRNTVAFTPYMGSFRHVRRFVGSRFSSSILTGRPSETSVRRLGCSALPLDPRARTFREETGNFDLLCPRTRRKVRGHFFREFSGLGSDLERCGAGPEALSRFAFFRAPKVPRSSRPTASESLSRTAAKIVIGKNPEFGVFAFPRRAWHHGRACFKPGWFCAPELRYKKARFFIAGSPFVSTTRGIRLNEPRGRRPREP